LKSFGLIPEIIGRLPLLCHLEQLDGKALRRILTEPKNSIIRQYIKIFKMDDVELVFEDEVLDYIVETAVDFKLGARGLRSIVETIMLDVMFDVPSSKEKKKVITLDYAKERMKNTNWESLRDA
jgi:ATP-dependent Clp protease ATP-binding subunit ClpX